MKELQIEIKNEVEVERVKTNENGFASMRTTDRIGLMMTTDINLTSLANSAKPSELGEIRTDSIKLKKLKFTMR